jgi:hypothetical protein
MMLTLFTCPEQKRRQAIREGFDRLADIVPGMEGQGRSEGLVLTETVKYMRTQLAERRELVQKLERGGAVVDEAMKELGSPFRPRMPSPALTCLKADQTKSQRSSA